MSEHILTRRIMKEIRNGYRTRSQRETKLANRQSA